MDKLAILRMNRVLKNLTEDELEKFAKIVRERHLPGGAILFREGEQGDALYIIAYGSIRILKTSKRGEEEVITLGTGAMFGELAMIDGSPRSATAIAMEKTDLLEVRREDLQQFFEEYPKIGLKLCLSMARLITSRLRATTNDLLFIKDLLKAKMPDFFE